jgi:magnesium transporter
MGACTFLHFGKSKISQLQNIQESAQAARKSGFVWLLFNDPTAEELAPLVEHFNIHPLSIEDCIDDNQIPKMDNFPDNTFFLFNAFTLIKNELCIDEVDLILGANFLITVYGHNARNPAFFEKLEDTVRRSVNEVARGPDFLMHVILDYVVDHKFQAIEQIRDEIENAEEEVLKSIGKFKPEQLLNMRRNLIGLRKSLFYERENLIKMCRRDCPHISEKSIYYYRDIYDHLAKFFEFIEINRETIAGLLELYLSMKNNQMAEAANRTNESMKRLTVITTIFMPLTLLSGIGGMSEWSTICGPENWAVSYPIFFGLMVVIGLGTYRLLRWKRWID